MNLENLAYTELTGTPYTDTATSITVSDGSVFPAVPFEAVIYNKRKNPGLAKNDGEAEIVEVTNIATNTLTVVRGQGGTTAVALSDTIDYAVIQGATKKVFNDSGLMEIVSKTAAFTLAASDFWNGKVLYQADVTSAFNITVPQDSAEDIPIGSIAYVETQDAQGTVVAGTGATLNPSTEVKTDTNLEAPLIAILKESANTWRVFGGVS